MISGLKFPLSINALGRFNIAQDSVKMAQNLRAIAMTSIQERWYEPNVGTVGYKLLFANIDSSIVQILGLIQNALNEQEPRVNCTVSGEETDPGILTITIRYRWRDTRAFDVTSFEVTV